MTLKKLLLSVKSLLKSHNIVTKRVDMINNKITQNDDKIGSLLEHVEILAHNISKLELPSTLSIATQSNAQDSLKIIGRLREKVLNYQKIAKTLANEVGSQSIIN